MVYLILGSFSRCIGVFDTVGALGLPEEISLNNKRARNLFGFPDRLLGEHVCRAYQALALNEPRADFVSVSLCWPQSIH